MASTNVRPSLIPHIHLLCLQKSASEAFTAAVQLYGLKDKISYTIHNTFLSELDPNVRFDLVVSPANSYGILDGGFDDAISRVWSPKYSYGALTRHVQSQLYREYCGMLPPGACHIIELPLQFQGVGREGWGARYLALCPTMRTPGDVTWDKEVAYECVWTLLAAIRKKNREGAGIRSILMTPLGTATGRVSDQKWATQAALAMLHHLDAVQNDKVWSQLNWPGIGVFNPSIVLTHEL